MRKPEAPLPVTPLITPAQRQAVKDGEQRRREYLETLDPRQREDLSWEGEG